MKQAISIIFAYSLGCTVALAQTSSGNVSPIGPNDGLWATIKLGDPGKCADLKGKEWPARWVLQCDGMFRNGQQTCVPASTCFSSDEPK